MRERTAIYVRYLAANVRAIRRSLDWTQGELADAAEIEPRSIRAIEAARTAPRLDTVVRIADALGVGVGELFRPARFAPSPRGRPRRDR